MYVIALPFFGIVSEVFPVFARKPLFGYSGLVYATLSIAALSVAVWAPHVRHRRGPAAVLLVLTFLIAVDRCEVLQLDRHHGKGT